MRPLRLKSLIVGGAAAVVLGVAVAAYATFADWTLNPGGIFHDDGGTRWDVVLETALSWFVPVALTVFVVVTTLHSWLVTPDERR
ncbi:MAG: hypothetical protein KDD11_22650 [Acidobacteria bacterium]|nr:hypothetical protein [Acidobacteriota bacterium]